MLDRDYRHVERRADARRDSISRGRGLDVAGATASSYTPVAGDWQGVIGPVDRLEDRLRQREHDLEYDRRGGPGTIANVTVPTDQVVRRRSVGYL